MSETQQQSIFGDAIEAVAELTTTGRVIRPFKRLVGNVADEYRLHITSDGIAVKVVDSANVLGGETTIHASAFDDYDVTEDTTIGLSSNQFGSVLQHARYGKSSDDRISLSIAPRTIESFVSREFGNAEATVTERTETIDPASIRQEPDIPPAEELQVDASVDIDPDTFNEVIGALSDDTHLMLGADDGELLIKQESDLIQRHISLDADVDSVEQYTYYSMSYINDIRNGLQNGYVDSLTLKWGEEYPLFAEFEREDVMSGRFMVAPRIRSD